MFRALHRAEKTVTLWSAGPTERMCIRLPLRIVRNDITKVAADAIVNTANPLPRIGAGTDSAIHEAAGPELLEARKAVGSIAVGSSVATPAFRLPARFVLHTVSPFWYGGQYREAALLRQAYDAALSLAEQLGCRSVAFPLMAAGSYGFPHALALSVAVQAFTDFLMEHDMTILLVLFNGKAFGLASSLFDDLKSYIDDRYAEDRSREEYVGSRDENGTDWRRVRAIRAKSAARESVSADAPPAAASVYENCALGLTPQQAAQTDLDGFLRRKESTFSEYLRDLLSERNEKDSAVYKRAEVSKQLFSKILSSKDYQPSKSTAIQLAIGLQLDLNQTKKLLDKAGYSLSRSSKADLVVEYFVPHNMYSVTFINEALYDCGLPLLKTGLKA